MKALLTFESSVMASDLRTCDAMTGNFAILRKIQEKHRPALTTLLSVKTL